MKKLLMSLTIVITITGQAQAAIVHYTDSTAFKGALVQTATFGVGDYSGWESASTGSLSDSATGFGLTGSTGDQFYDSVWYNLAEGVEFMTTDGSGTSILMTLSEGINAIGGYFGADDSMGVGPVTVTLTNTLDESSEVLVDYNQGLDLGTPAFNGWIVTGSELASLQIDADSSVYPAFGKDLVLGSTVPEPASLIIWGLLASGCAGVAVVRRRRRGATGTPWSEENRQTIRRIVDGGRFNK